MTQRKLYVVSAAHVWVSSGLTDSVKFNTAKANNTRTYLRLDGCIVWNAHNTVFGSKRSFLYIKLHISTSLSFVMTDMSRDSIVDRHCLRQRHVPHAVAENLGEVSCMQLYRPGE